MPTTCPSPPPLQLSLPLASLTPSDTPSDVPTELLDAWVRQQWQHRPWLRHTFRTPEALLADPERARCWRLCARQALLLRQRRNPKRRTP